VASDPTVTTEITAHPMSSNRDAGFTRLFSESRDALSRYVRRLVRSQSAAEEIVQEAFLQTYTYRGKVEVPRAFLFSAARLLASKARRHDRVVQDSSAHTLEADLLPPQDLSPEEKLLAEERIRLLKQVVDSLPRQCRTALTLRVFQDCSYKEIAARLGISVRTVEKHLALGLREIHAELTRAYQEGEDRG
jgi:RNA polymerase sigma factor (sigma-70 family)